MHRKIFVPAGAFLTSALTPVAAAARRCCRSALPDRSQVPQAQSHRCLRHSAAAQWRASEQAHAGPSYYPAAAQGSPLGAAPAPRRQGEGHLVAPA